MLAYIISQGLYTILKCCFPTTLSESLINKFSYIASDINKVSIMDCGKIFPWKWICVDIQKQGFIIAIILLLLLSLVQVSEARRGRRKSTARCGRDLEEQVGFYCDVKDFKFPFKSPSKHSKLCILFM